MNKTYKVRVDTYLSYNNIEETRIKTNLSQKEISSKLEIGYDFEELERTGLIQIIATEEVYNKCTDASDSIEIIEE